MAAAASWASSGYEYCCPRASSAKRAWVALSNRTSTVATSILSTVFCNSMCIDE